MAESHSSLETGRGRSVYPAIAVAAIAGIAITYLVMRKSKGADEALPVEKVVNICNSAAEKLDKFVSQALAS
jgi:hypothetical protein